MGTENFEDPFAPLKKKDSAPQYERMKRIVSLLDDMNESSKEQLFDQMKTLTDEQKRIVRFAASIQLRLTLADLTKRSAGLDAGGTMFSPTRLFDKEPDDQGEE